jgi:ATP-dependent Zn protease
MSELGIVSKDDLSQKKVHGEIDKLIEVEEERVRKIITKNQSIMSEIVEVLLEEESVEGEEFRTKLGIEVNNVA